MSQLLYGSFNLSKIRFTLDLFKTPEEKISYLYHVKIEINRVIQCFSGRKYLPLRKYSLDNIFIEDNCPELKEFLKKILNYYNSNGGESRFPGESLLLRHVKKEVIEYKKLSRIIDAEIKYLTEKRDVKSAEKIEHEIYKNLETEKAKNSTNKKIKNKMENVDLNKNVDQEKERQIVSSSHTSIRKLKEENKKIVWQGTQSDLIYFFDQLYDMDFMSIKGYDEIFSIISNFFVDKEGEPFRTDKVAEIKLKQRKNSMPKGYVRYMNAIEKLKFKGSED